MVENAIAQLNKLTTTIKTNMQPADRGNLEIYFLDSTNQSHYDHIIQLSNDNKSQYSYSFGKNEYITSLVQALNIQIIPQESRQNYLTNTLVFTLFPFYWQDSKYNWNEKANNDLPKSIFRSIRMGQRDELYYEELHEFDKKLLQTVYSADFEQNLALKVKQYKPVIPGWVSINPYSFLLLPFLLLLLLILVGYLKISKRLIQRVSNKFLRFNINGLVLALFFSIIASFYFSLAYDLKFNLLNFSQLQKNLTAGTFLTLIIGIPTINLLRFFEIIIHKNTHRKILRTALIFLTTGLLPFIAFFAFLYFVTILS